MKKTYFNWSTGKDAALALYYLNSNSEYQVTKLITTVNSDFKRVSMHGLRESLLDAQAESIGIPLQKLYLSGAVSMADYDAAMKDFTEVLVSEKYEYSAFGDIFLQDLKEYREDRLEKVGLKAVFPLWMKNTRLLLEELLSLGFKAITVCVNAKLLDVSFVGRIIDEAFIEDLPENVDPCGENGEFHTFVFDGPIFKKPVDFVVGEKVLRSYDLSEDDADNCFADDAKTWDTRFWYCDLLPK